jgi:hypothetical protein
LTTTLRILFNNHRGIKLGPSILSTTHSLSAIESLGVGALCIAEANLNWNKKGVHKKVKEVVLRIWENYSMNYSFTNEQFSSDNQPGGTMSVITNNWTSRILEKGVNPFGSGRWSYFVLRGKGDIKVMIISAYRVSQQYLASVGPKTSAMQQFHTLSQQFRAAEVSKEPKVSISNRSSILDRGQDKGFLQNHSVPGLE